MSGAANAAGPTSELVWLDRRARNVSWGRLSKGLGVFLGFRVQRQTIANRLALLHFGHS